MNTIQQLTCNPIYVIPHGQGIIFKHLPGLSLSEYHICAKFISEKQV